MTKSATRMIKTTSSKLLAFTTKTNPSMMTTSKERVFQGLKNLKVKYDLLNICWSSGSYINSFLSSGVYKSFEKNLVALDEGKNLGVKYGVSYDTCESFCESTLGCESFVHCTMFDTNTGEAGDCWPKDKILGGSEPTRNDSNGNQCTSYFKVKGMWADLESLFEFLVLEVIFHRI